MALVLALESTYAKLDMIQGRLAWPLRKDDTYVREGFHIFQQRLQERTRYKPCLPSIILGNVASKRDGRANSADMESKGIS